MNSSQKIFINMSFMTDNNYINTVQFLIQLSIPKGALKWKKHI